MTRKFESPEPGSIGISRKPYVAPALTSFGSVAELTTSGSTDTPEGTGVGNSDKAPQP